MAAEHFPKPPRCPPGLGPAGSRLWRAIVARFELTGEEATLLTEACRVADRLGQLEAAIAQAGPVGADGKPHPAMVEARQQQVVLARLIASLRIPDDDQAGQPQRRGAARGAYRLHPAAGE